MGNNEHNKLFIKLFRNRVVDQLTTKYNYFTENLRWLAHGPRTDILSYHGYPTNGYYFYTKARDKNCTVNKSRVTLLAQSMHISGTKDNKQVFANMSY